MIFGEHLILPEQIVFESKKSTILVNIRPFLKYHLLVVPNCQKSRLSDLTEDEYLDLFLTARKAIFNLKSLGDGFTMTVQDGESAGQTVSHVHVHLIPRNLGDLKNNNDVYKETNLDVKKTNRSLQSMKEEAEFLRKFF